MDFKSVYFVQNKLICITLWRFVLMITCNMLTQKHMLTLTEIS